MKPTTEQEWFKKLSPLEQKKQIRRWRYRRQYWGRKYGDDWVIRSMFAVGVL